MVHVRDACEMPVTRSLAVNWYSGPFFHWQYISSPFMSRCPTYLLNFDFFLAYRTVIFFRPTTYYLVIYILCDTQLQAWSSTFVFTVQQKEIASFLFSSFSLFPLSPLFHIRFRTRPVNWVAKRGPRLQKDQGFCNFLCNFNVFCNIKYGCKRA